MLFNSFEYFLFLPVTFLLYWLINRFSLKVQNIFLLTASYFFYAQWDVRYLLLILFSSVVDFLIGKRLGVAKVKSHRKFLLGISLVVNLGMLAVFKYYNFFIDSFATLLNGFGLTVHTSSLSLVLPVGISFYTFQTMSYTIDIYKGKLKPTKDAVAFFAFVSFFPQLVAGPIERANHLLPQFLVKKTFDRTMAVEGMRQILWGLFKKIVIADSCAVFVNHAFANYENLNGSALFLGLVYFGIQIYGDFSGYSSIAIGTAKLFGIRLMDNFRTPYFSSSIPEFWKRWHISLSSWFRDYVYIPLGGNRKGKGRKIWNSFITFTLSGLWHGANLKFVVWGALNGLYFIPYQYIRGKKNQYFRMMGVIITFSLITLAWAFFRAESFTEGTNYLSRVLNQSMFSVPNALKKGVVYVVPLFIVEYILRKRKNEFDLSFLPLLVRWSIYLCIGLLVLGYFGDKSEFIYFQF